MKTCDHGMPILGIVRTCGRCIDIDNRAIPERQEYLDRERICLAAIDGSDIFSGRPKRLEEECEGE